MKCQYCGAECADKAIFCEQCGRKLVNICPQCGTKCSDNAKFCEQCGAFLEKEPVNPTVEEKDDGWIDSNKNLISTTGILEGKRRYKKGKGKPVSKKEIIILIVIFIVGAVGITMPYII